MSKFIFLFICAVFCYGCSAEKQYGKVSLLVSDVPCPDCVKVTGSLTRSFGGGYKLLQDENHFLTFEADSIIKHEDDFWWVSTVTAWETSHTLHIDDNERENWNKN